MIKIASTTSVLYQYTIEDAVDVIEKTGYDGVDIWGGRPHAYRHDLSSQELGHLRRRIEDLGLIVSSFMPAFYRYPYSLSNPNPIVREDSIAYMCECIDNAVSLGARIVLVVPDHSLANQEREDSLKRMIESIDVVAKYAYQYDDLNLGIEVLYYDETDLINSIDDALSIIGQLGNKNIGVVLDTGTLNLSKESPQEIITKLGSKLLQVHVNDNQGIDRQQNLIPGDGNYDFKNLIRMLKDQGYSGFLSAELSKEYSDNPTPALQITAERLRDWIS